MLPFHTDRIQRQSVKYMRPKQKPKADDFNDESLPYHLGTGSYVRATVERQKVREIKVVGFVRKQERVNKTKIK